MKFSVASNYKAKYEVLASGLNSLSSEGTFHGPLSYLFWTPLFGWDEWSLEGFKSLQKEPGRLVGPGDLPLRQQQNRDINPGLCSRCTRSSAYIQAQFSTALNARNCSRVRPRGEILHCSTFHRLYAHPTHSGLSERRPNLCRFKFSLDSELVDPTGKECSAVPCFQLPQCWLCFTANL